MEMVHYQHQVVQVVDLSLIKLVEQVLLDKVTLEEVQEETLTLVVVVEQVQQEDLQR
jgi:hypothetical protein